MIADYEDGRDIKNRSTRPLHASKLHFWFLNAREIMSLRYLLAPAVRRF